MRGKHSAGTAAVVILAYAANVHATVIWSDDFESYVNQAAFDVAYEQLHPGEPLLLDTTHGHGGCQSILTPSALAGYGRQAGRAFGREVAGTDSQPLKFEVWVVPETADDWWTRGFVQLKSYGPDGDLEGIIAMGCNSSGVPDTSRYAGRVWPGGTNGSSLGWQSLHAFKSSDWVKLTALIKTGTVEFYVNDVLDTVDTRTPGITYDQLVFGFGLPTRVGLWWDDILVERVPEPGTIALLAASGVLLPWTRGKRAVNLERRL